MNSPESQLEDELIKALGDLKYEIRADIRDRAALEKNFCGKFQALNHVRLTDAEFDRLLEEIVTPDVFTAARTLRNRTSFTRDDGAPPDKDLSNYTLVNIKDGCKNTFEVVSQLRINSDYSHHRYEPLQQSIQPSYILNDLQRQCLAIDTPIDPNMVDTNLARLI